MTTILTIAAVSAMVGVGGVIPLYVWMSEPAAAPRKDETP